MSSLSQRLNSLAGNKQLYNKKCALSIIHSIVITFQIYKGFDMCHSHSSGDVFLKISAIEYFNVFSYFPITFHWILDQTDVPFLNQTLVLFKN